MIKNLFFVLVFLGAVGYPVYHFFMKPVDLEFSAIEPLGKFAKIEAFVQRWDYFDKSTSTVDEEMARIRFGGRFEDEKLHVFTWKEKRENGYARHIQVVVDAGGFVQAIHAEFPSKTAEARPPELTSEKLIWMLWQEIAGREPRFGRTKDYDGNVFYVDTFEAKGVKGSWVKSYKVPPRDQSIHDSVQVYRASGEGG